MQVDLQTRRHTNTRVPVDYLKTEAQINLVHLRELTNYFCGDELYWLICIFIMLQRTLDTGSVVV